MPIYEYDCPKCGTYEVIQKITEPALEKCEKCQGPVRKLISESSFALKGGGWYKDLYSSTNKGGGGSSGNSGSGGGSSSSGSGSGSGGKSSAAA